MQLVRVDRNNAFYMQLPEKTELPQIIFASQGMMPGEVRNTARVNIPGEFSRVLAFDNDADLVKKLIPFYPRSGLVIITKIV